MKKNKELKLNQLKDYANKNNVPIIRDEELIWLTNYIIENNVKTILEIGTAIGYSSMAFTNVSSDIFVESIELSKERFDFATDVTKDNDQILLHNADCLEIENSIFKHDKYDMIFLDGPKASFIKQFEKYSPLLSDGGTIIVDNIHLRIIRDNEEKMKNKSKKRIITKIDEFIEWVKNNSDYNLEVIDIDDGIAKITRR